jgi:hypothetical protein
MTFEDITHKVSAFWIPAFAGMTAENMADRKFG